MGCWIFDEVSDQSAMYGEMRTNNAGSRRSVAHPEKNERIRRSETPSDRTVGWAPGMSSLAVPSLAVPGAVPRGSRTRRSSSVPAPRLATDKRGASVLPSASAGKSPRRPRRDQFLLALVSIRAARSNRSREPLPLRSGPFPRAHRRSPTSRPNSNEQTMTEVRPP